ncbi:MAG: hypothetical protein ACLST4_02690 [Bifidobacterium pseudocatenulatum]
MSQAHILEKQSRRRTADSTGSPKWVDSKNPLSGFFYVRLNVANAKNIHIFPFGIENGKI